MNIVSLQGSPSAVSRSAALLQVAQSRLQECASRIDAIVVRELPPQALMQAQFGDAAIRDAVGRVQQAQLVLVATPIYKAAYSGLLKSFLDLLPQDALRDKIVLPLATGGSPAHLLALDYALKPVLAALGARDILDAVYANDAQFESVEGGFRVDAAVVQRVERSLRRVIAHAAAWPSPGAQFAV